MWKERHEKGEEETEGEAGLATQAQRIDDTNRTAITHPLTAPTYTPRRPHAQAKKKKGYTKNPPAPSSHPSRQWPPTLQSLHPLPIQYIRQQPLLLHPLLHMPG